MDINNNYLCVCFSKEKYLKQILYKDINYFS